MWLQEAAQTPVVMNEFYNVQFVNILHHLALGGLIFVLVSGCAILLFRTSAGLRNSRFLKHLAIAFALNAAGALESIVYQLLRAALAFFAIDLFNSTHQLPLSFHEGLNLLNSTHHGLSVMISLLSNVFLFATWDLLRRFPSQGVRRSLYTALTTFFGSGSLLIVLIDFLDVFKRVREHFWLIVDYTDLVSSALGILLIGWQLQKTLGPKIKKNIWKITLPWLTLMPYLIWGGAQLFHFHRLFRWNSGYVTVLLISSLCAAIMTIILCSHALDEKSEYSST
jgi:hypothetical protein